MRVEAAKSGLPERPPVSALFPLRRLSGRAIVVFETIMPSTLRRRATATMPSSSGMERSGAILISTGVGLAPAAASSRAASVCAISSSSALSACRSRRPGVFGEETLTVRKSASGASRPASTA